MSFELHNTNIPCVQCDGDFHKEPGVTIIIRSGSLLAIHKKCMSVWEKENPGNLPRVLSKSEQAMFQKKGD